MPGSEIVVITQGGGTRTPAVRSVGYPVSAGDAAENIATSGPAVFCVHVNNAMQTTDIYLSPGQKHTFAEAGAFTVP